MALLGDDEDPPTLVEKDRSITPAVWEVDGRGEHGDREVKVPITIVTEFGDTADIEKSLTVAQDGQEVEEWINLANGCICCSIKDSGVNALESLMERKGAFDYILLETTGLADPGNIAPIFWVDEGLGSSIYLDGIVTVVDAKNILTSLDEPGTEELPAATEGDKSAKLGLEHEHTGPLMTTAHLQISHADTLILNKSDLVSPSDLQSVKDRITSINSLAKMVTTTYSRVPGPQLSGTLLDLRAYSTFTDPDFTAKGHSHLDQTISTISLPLPQFDEQKVPLLENWLRSLLWNEGSERRDYEIHRMKGRIVMTDGSVKIVQGVREIFEIVDAPDTAERTDTGTGEGKIVLIGRGMDKVPGLNGLAGG